MATDSPRRLWSGAGTGEGRPALLRAHDLLASGVIAGEAFAPGLATAGVELARRWFARRLGAAVFVDAERPVRAPVPARFFADAGVGLRVYPPGHRGHFRLDFAAGLNDRAHAFSLAWQSRD